MQVVLGAAIALVTSVVVTLLQTSAQRRALAHSASEAAASRDHERLLASEERLQERRASACVDLLTVVTLLEAESLRRADMALLIFPASGTPPEPPGPSEAAAIIARADAYGSSVVMGRYESWRNALASFEAVLVSYEQARAIGQLEAAGDMLAGASDRIEALSATRNALKAAIRTELSGAAA